MTAMGTVTARVEVIRPNGQAGTEALEALVDTGATLSVLPGRLLDEVGIERVAKVGRRLADGRRIERYVGDVRMRLEGQAVWARVVFGEPSDPTLIGLTVLEQLGLTVDPVQRRLVPTEFILY